MYSFTKPLTSSLYHVTWLSSHQLEKWPLLLWLLVVKFTYTYTISAFHYLGWRILFPPMMRYIPHSLLWESLSVTERLVVISGSSTNKIYFYGKTEILFESSIWYCISRKFYSELIKSFSLLKIWLLTILLWCYAWSKQLFNKYFSSFKKYHISAFLTCQINCTLQNCHDNLNIYAKSAFTDTIKKMFSHVMVYFHLISRNTLWWSWFFHPR